MNAEQARMREEVQADARSPEPESNAQPAKTCPRSHQGDNGGSAFDKLWRTLLEKVHLRFWWLHWPRIEDAVAVVILRHLNQPKGFRRTVEEGIGDEVLRSLYYTACREVGDSVRGDRRCRRREREYARQKKIGALENFFVQNGHSVANIFTEEQREELERLLDDCEEGERAFVALRREGKKDPRDYVELLGMTHCSLEEQRRAVKRTWNRIRMKLRRLRARRAK
ncbi:MAG: hypothetical protein ACYC3I_11630 [Gemmataceae bacterium]